MNSLPNIDKQLVDLEQVLQILREEQNPEIFIEATINYLRSHFDYRLIWIGLYEKLQHYILGKGGFSNQGDSSLFKQRFNLHSGDLLEQVLIQQQQIPIADLRQENRAGEWRQAAQKLGIQGAIFVPIRYKDRCFGVALLGSHLWGISPRPGDKAHLSSLLGALAMALYHNEKESLVNHSQKIDKVFFKLLDELVHLTSLEQKLNKIVSVTNELISNTRTNIYWYNSEQRYFWVKGNNQLANVKKTATNPSLNVEEVSEFYQYLISGQLVAIGAGKSPLKTETTGRLLARLRVRSILAMPIFIQQKLVGFLAVEGSEARIWEEGEKNYLQSATQILAMSMANDEMAIMLKEVQEENNLVAEVATAIASYKNIQDALSNCANLLLGRLGVEGFLLLQTEGNNLTQNTNQVDQSLMSSMTNYQGGLTSYQTTINYQVVFQQHNRNPRGVIASLPLGENDHKLLFTPGKIIAIEDWETDKRLTHWREILMPLGVKSLLVCSSTSGGLLVLANSNTKTWQHTDYTLIPIISQQIGQLLYLLGRDNDIINTTKANQILMKGLNTLLFGSLDPTLFERNFMDFFAKTLEFPLTLLITWSSRRSKAKLAVRVVNDSRFELPQDFDISMETDPLLQKVISANDIISYSVIEGHRTWVSLMGAKKVYMIPLTWQGQPMKGIILLGDTIGREIPNDLLPVLKILVQQFAQLRQYRRWNMAVQKQVSDLEQLNWYKHSYLSSLHQDFKGLSLNLTQAYSTIKMPNAAQSLLSDLTETITELEELINQEEWEIKLNLKSVPLVNILNKTLRSIDAITTQRKLLIYVHNAKGFNIYVDQVKLEYVLWEIFLNICNMLHHTSKIEVWCLSKKFPVDQSSNDTTERAFVELLIMQQRAINPDLLENENNDFIFDGNFKELPSSHLKICQRILRSWGCELLFYELENGHFLYQLLLSQV